MIDVAIPEDRNVVQKEVESMIMHGLANPKYLSSWNSCFSFCYCVPWIDTICTHYQSHYAVRSERVLLLLDSQQELRIARLWWCYEELSTLFSIHTACGIVPFPRHKLSFKGNMRRNLSVERISSVLLSHSLSPPLSAQLQNKLPVPHFLQAVVWTEKRIVTDHL